MYTSVGGAGFYTNTFDSLGFSTNQTLDGTPNGQQGYLSGEWTCYINATANSYGTIASAAPNVSGPGAISTWTNPYTGQFANYASYFDYAGRTNFYTNNALPGYGTNLYGAILDTNVQNNESNRCLGIRQTGGFGDPGAAFVLKLANTALYHNFAISVDVMNLDPTSVRETTWMLQYGVDDPVVGVPAAFQTFANLSATYANPPGNFHWKTIHFTIPDGQINNIPGGVWLRLVAINSSVNSGNRQTFAIDNFGLTWQTGNGGCSPANGTIVMTPPAPPVYVDSTVSFQVNTAGSQPIYYQWRLNGTPIDFNDPEVVGNSYRSSTLTLQGVTTADNGNYDCIISNVCSGIVYTNTSPVATLAVTTVPAVSIGYLRTLGQSNSSAGPYDPTVSSSQLFQITGMITTVTNTTSGDTSSYYIQDATGGLNFFVTGGASIRPQIGDVVTEIGYLDQYEGNLELEADLTDATHISGNTATAVDDLSNNIAAYPVAKTLNWATEFAVGVTNNTVEIGATNSQGAFTAYSKKGSICILTDVHFGTNAGHVITGNYYAYVTNSAGLGGWVFFWGAEDNDVYSNTIPAYAYSVQGPLFADTADNFWSGIGVSKWADVVTNALTVQAAWVQNAPQLSWTAVAQTYSYSVLAAPTVTGPWTPIATGLNFPDTNGNYTDMRANGNQQFYRVTTP